MRVLVEPQFHHTVCYQTHYTNPCQLSRHQTNLTVVLFVFPWFMVRGTIFSQFKLPCVFSWQWDVVSWLTSFTFYLFADYEWSNTLSSMWQLFPLIFHGWLLLNRNSQLWYHQRYQLCSVLFFKDLFIYLFERDGGRTEGGGRVKEIFHVLAHSFWLVPKPHLLNYPGFTVHLDVW